MNVFGFIHFIFSARKVLRRHCPIENFSTKLITRQLCRKYSCGQIIQKVLKSWQLLCLPTILKGYLCPFCKKRGILRYNTITEPEQIRTHKNFFVAAMLIFSSSGLEVLIFLFLCQKKRYLSFISIKRKDSWVFVTSTLFIAATLTSVFMMVLLFLQHCCFTCKFVLSQAFLLELEKRERERK